MNKRTWDIIARYVSEEHGIKVVLKADCEGPRICLDTMTIELPERIKEQNALAALSSLMHEAAHMKYSTIIPKDLSKTNIDHYILNAMEDVRIDKKNFGLLPNVWDFYEKFVKEHLCTKENKAKILEQHMLVRSMITLILMGTGFDRYTFDKEAKQFIYDNGLENPFYLGIYSIDCGLWTDVTKCIDEIKSKFNIKEEPAPSKVDVTITTGGGDGKGKGTGVGVKASDCKGNDSGSEKGDSSAGKCNGQDGQGQDKPKDTDANAGMDSGNSRSDIKDPEEFVRPASMWGKGSGLKGPGGLEFNPAELQETTKRKFVDSLNIKERYIQSDGSKLNTDDLVSFFTGDVEELFVEDDIEKVKRSKIVFCLDASGSMGSDLFDKTSCKETLGSCMKSMIQVLNEIRETEGLNVDYDIIAFDEFPHVLSKDNWEQEYRMISGGTSVLNAVDKSIQILNDSEIDGNKLIILVTDGEVSDWEIDAVKDLIMRFNSEVKAILIGIGANSKYCEKICGDNNIICSEHADQIIMEAIQLMLEG